MNSYRPSSSARFHARLAQREGFDFTPGPLTAAYCQLFDSAIGGSGPTSEQTTQTVSGTSRGVTGKRNQYTETGSIGVGEKGTYTESGALVLSGKGAKNLAKGSKDLSGANVKGDLTVSDVSNGFSADDVATVIGSFFNSTPPSAGGLGATVAVNPSNPDSATTQPGTTMTPTDTTTSPSMLDNFKAWLSGLSTAQKIAGAVALVLLGWLLFRKRG